MKTTVEIAPYSATLHKENGLIHVVVTSEDGKEAARANWNIRQAKWVGIRFTVKKMSMVHDLITVFDSIITEAKL